MSLSSLLDRSGLNQPSPIARGVAVLWGINIGLAATVVPLHLENASRQQCQAHDWPPSQHQAHVDWCEREGYLH